MLFYTEGLFPAPRAQEAKNKKIKMSDECVKTEDDSVVKEVPHLDPIWCLANASDEILAVATGVDARFRHVVKHMNCLGGRINSTQKDNRRNKANLELLAARVNQIECDKEGGATSTSISKDITRLDRNAGYLTLKVESVKNSIKKVLNEVGKRDGEVGERLSALEKNPHLCQENDHEQQIDEIRELVHECDARVDNQDERIDVHSGKLAVMSETLDGLLKKSDDHGDSLDGLQKAMAEANARKVTWINENTSAINKNTTELKEHHGRLCALESNVEHLMTRTDAHRDMIASGKNSCRQAAEMAYVKNGGLEKTVNNLKDFYAVQSNKMADLQELCKAHEDRLRSMDDLDVEVAGLKKRFDRNVALLETLDSTCRSFFREFATLKKNIEDGKLFNVSVSTNAIRELVKEETKELVEEWAKKIEETNESVNASNRRLDAKERRESKESCYFLLCKGVDELEKAVKDPCHMTALERDFRGWKDRKGLASAFQLNDLKKEFDAWKARHENLLDKDHEIVVKVERDLLEFGRKTELLKKGMDALDTYASGSISKLMKAVGEMQECEMSEKNRFCALLLSRRVQDLEDFRKKAGEDISINGHSIFQHSDELGEVRRSVLDCNKELQRRFEELENNDKQVRSDHLLLCDSTRKLADDLEKTKHTLINDINGRIDKLGKTVTELDSVRRFFPEGKVENWAYSIDGRLGVNSERLGSVQRQIEDMQNGQRSVNVTNVEKFQDVKKAVTTLTTRCLRMESKIQKTKSSRDHAEARITALEKRNEELEERLNSMMDCSK